MTLLEIYQKHVKLQKAMGDEWKGLCPFHVENTPSFFVNSRNGFFYCFGCGRSGGIRKFLELSGDSTELNEIERDERLKSYVVTFSEPISPVVVQQLHKNLLNDIYQLEYVLRKRFLSMFVVKKFLVGYDPEADRISFPIKSRSGDFVNIKLHNSRKDPKSLSWSKGHGKPRLYPISATLKNEIVICEGEFDCLALHSRGINAITSTAGANQPFKENGWLEFFAGHSVTILFDYDEAGFEAGAKLADQLTGIARRVRILRYPAWAIDHVEGKKMDVTDFIKLGGNVKQLIEEKW